MDLQLWLAFSAASLVILLMPGPTVLLVLSYALTQGRKVAIATVAGVAMGDLLAMSLSLAGLGVLLKTSVHVFTIVKWAGAVYLLWLGFRMFRRAGTPVKEEDTGTGTAGRVFLHTMTVTLLNPKSLMFFIAFVPQFVVPDTALLPQFSLLIVTFVGLGALNALAYALLADKLRHSLSSSVITHLLPRLGGLLLMGMGVLAFFMRRSHA